MAEAATDEGSRPSKADLLRDPVWLRKQFEAPSVTYADVQDEIERLTGQRPSTWAVREACIRYGIPSSHERKARARRRRKYGRKVVQDA